MLINLDDSKMTMRSDIDIFVIWGSPFVYRLLVSRDQRSVRITRMVPKGQSSRKFHPMNMSAAS